MQRKTLLSGAFFFATLIWYQHWSRRRDPKLYVAALITYAAAALAKPAVASLPCILLLYDYVFVERRGRWKHTLPFFAIAGAACLAAAAAHAEIGATHGPHGGSLVVHVLIVSRALLESIAALLLPLDLSPIYYYPKSSGYWPLNFVALAFLPLVLVFVTLRRAASVGVLLRLVGRPGLRTRGQHLSPGTVARGSLHVSGRRRRRHRIGRYPSPPAQRGETERGARRRGRGNDPRAARHAQLSFRDCVAQRHYRLDTRRRPPPVVGNGAYDAGPRLPRARGT
jgi:hypothetical protein